jgi:replicative DNA helicase
MAADYPRRERQPELPSPDGRIPPNDLDAEAAILSAILIDPSAIDKVLQFLRAEHFYSEAHRRIFEAALELREKGQPVDYIQVSSYLRDRERLQQVGGMPFLTELLNVAPALANVEAYAETVFEKSRVRQIILAAQRVVAEGYVDYGNAQAFIDRAEQSIYQIARTGSSSSVEHIRPILIRSFEKMQAAAQNGSWVTGVPTGFDRYDRLTSGLHEGDLSIVAARPGMGKTSFVLNIAQNVSRPRIVESPDQPGKRSEVPGVAVMVFSLEMPREQLTNRMLASEARVDVSKMRSRALTTEDWAKLTTAAALLSRLPIHIDDTPSVTLLEVRAKMRRLIAEYEHKSEGTRVGLLIIDYLQLMKGRDGVTSREQEISEISRGLKGLSKELKLPVIALSQLNRAVESRSEKSKRPMLSDLRESGAIEQDADNIIFIYRDDYYNKEESEEQGIAEIILAKHRNGATDTVKVRFEREYTRFSNLPEGEFTE